MHRMAGNAWYFGQATLSYENTPAGDDRLVRSGVDGAQPGVVMLADAGWRRLPPGVPGRRAKTTLPSSTANGSITVPAGSYGTCARHQVDPARAGRDRADTTRRASAWSRRQIFGGTELVKLTKVTPAPDRQAAAIAAQLGCRMRRILPTAGQPSGLHDTV
jgi:hypothetical protein